MMKILYAIAVLSLLACSTFSKPAFRGPLPQEQKDIIHFLALHHSELKRNVTMTETGYTAITTSTNEAVVAKLKDHFSYMQKRLDSGAMVRRWDPAFEEMVEYYDELSAEIKLLENGFKITVVGKTPEAVLVARNHARIVTGFVEEGQSAVEREHKAVITE